MIKVHHGPPDGNGLAEILGFYPDDVHYPGGIPVPFIEIDEAAHADCIANLGRRRVNVAAGQIVEWAPPGPTAEQVGAAKLAEIYASYLAAKTAIVWSNSRGYDADTGSRADFFEVKGLVKDDLDEWVENGRPGPEPTRPYKVYTNPDDLSAKSFLPHTFGDFVAAHRAGADVQTEAYVHFDNLRAQLKAAMTIEAINAVPTW